MPTIETDAPEKAKTTVYMIEEEEKFLNKLFIKRLGERRKTDNGLLEWRIRSTRFKKGC